MNKKLKYFWGMGDLGYTVFHTVSKLYFAYFLTDVICLPMKYVGFILMFTSILDFILVPVSGAFIEGTKAMRQGRYRSWIFLCPFAVLLFFPFCFLGFGTPLLNAVIICSAFLLYSFFASIGNTANHAIIPLIAKHEKQRIALVSNKLIYSNCGAPLGGYIIPLLINGILLVYFSPQSAYMLMAVIAGFVLLAGYQVHYRLSADYDNARLTPAVRLPLRTMVAVLLKTKPLFAVMFADAASSCCAFVLPALAVYYYNNIVGQPSLLAVHLLVTGITAVVGAWCSRFIVRRFHSRTACLIVYPIMAILLFCAGLAANNPYLFIAVNAALYLFSGTTQPMEQNMYLDTVIYSRQKTGIDAKGFILGVSRLSIKFSHILKSTIISVTFLAVGYTAGSNTSELKNGIIAAYSLVPVILLALGWLALFFFYRLTPEKMKTKKISMYQRFMQEKGILPWDVDAPEPWIMKLHEEGRIRGSVFDSGCGPGRNALYLASQGYEVTGMDIEKVAIERAKEHAENRNLNVNFFVSDVSSLSKYSDSFDTVFDIGCYHSMYLPEQRKNYTDNLYRMARKDAVIYLRAFEIWKRPNKNPKFCVPEEWIKNDFSSPRFTILKISRGEVDTLTDKGGKAEVWFVEIKCNK
ncbi:MAG: MFS transporter [Dysgonamonadaceae bacterium]|jgi:GPH family glycoside/pentoside/hexuronide:cation symporter|nr:MFS transporter [Dysgonamonadaceae bacterium]